jgi:hypothetical protein
MDIQHQIDALWKEHEELAIHKKDIHKRMVGLRTRIGKLKTVIKHAQEVLETPLETLKKIEAE